MKKILITTGGTGGHVIPAKIIQEHLMDNFDIYFSTDIRGLKYFQSNTDKIVIINTPYFNYSVFFPFRFLKVIYLIIKAILFLKKKKIETVISIGGYMSLPVVIASKILGIRNILFEPNLVLGRGNRFFLNFSNKIFCYSKNLLNFPKKHAHKIELINPLIFKTFYQQNKNNNINKKFCFLISGGSQGAKFFDDFMKNIITDIAKNFEIKVIQQTSKNNIKNLKDYYDYQNIENKIFSFEKNFINLINNADLCITRAGATSLAEISFLNKPFIAIPLPSAKDDHQMQNALFYEKKGCCWVLNKKTINKEKILNIIFSILKDKSR